MRRAIVLFARSPQREASEKRMRFAAPLFRRLVAAWLDAAQRHGATPVIACAADDRNALASIAPRIEREWIEQRGWSFGERAAHAAGDAFACGFGAIILAAIDAPPHDLREAFAQLERGISVISPSRDGGINFIGLIEPEPELLAQLTPRRRDLVEVCRRYFERNAGVSPADPAASKPPFHILRSTIDLDNERALAIAKTDRAWRELLPQTRAAQPRDRATAQPAIVSVWTPRAPPL